MESSDVSDGSNKRTHEALHVDSNKLSPERSRTDPTPTQKSHLHRRLGSSALRNKTFNVPGSKHGTQHNYSRRQHAKEAVQSAMDLKPPISFDLLRRDKKYSDNGRPDNTAPTSHNAGENGEPSVQQRQEEMQRRVSPEQIRLAKQQNATRQLELRESLRKVEAVAMSNTRQLDDTYYTILEKASLLRSTLAGLQQLADESRQMHDSFQADSSSLEKNIQQKLDSFQDFKSQEEAMNKLISQLSQAKEKTNNLNERLENAWTRVEQYEEREKEKQTTRRKRWRWSSFITFVIVAAFVFVITSKHRLAFSDKLHGAVKQVDELGGDILHPVAALLKPLIHREEDPYLQKLFDEL